MQVDENSPQLWNNQLPTLAENAHKYKRGYLIINGGPIESTGAAKLSAISALRMGAGLVSIACSKEALSAYAPALMAVMTKPVEVLEDFKQLIEQQKVSAILLGPGNGLNQKTRAFVLAALTTRKPVVLDADALTVFEENPQELFDKLHENVVLTPHEGEFARLFGRVPSTQERGDAAISAALKSEAVVVLKGHHTVIASPCGKRCVVNKNAPAFLATAGSGDVLAGMISGLVAQSMSVFDAACAAVWMHAEAAALYGKGLIAEDIPDLLPRILKSL